MKYLIIGFSAAGLAAVKAIRDADSDAEITVVTEETHDSYSRCLLPYYLTGRVKMENVYLLSPEELLALRVNLKKGVKALAVDVDNREVTLSKGEGQKYDKLLIATGAAPFVPQFPAIDKERVYALRGLDDAIDIEKSLNKDATAVILGDGLVSVMTAQALNKRGMKVQIVGLAENILSQFLDKQGTLLAEQILTEMGIDFYMGRTIKEISHHTSGKLQRVIMSDGNMLPADILIIAIGVKPNMAFLEGTPILKDQGILVNNYMETNIKGVYAAGDVAQSRNLLTGVDDVVALWTVATEQGRLAGLNMTGAGLEYSGALAMNSVNIGDKSFISAGIANPQEEGYKIYQYNNPQKQEYRKLVIRAGRLVGYILVGSTQKAGILSALIKKREDVTTIIENLCAGEISYPKLSTCYI